MSVIIFMGSSNGSAGTGSDENGSNGIGNSIVDENSDSIVDETGTKIS